MNPILQKQNPPRQPQADDLQIIKQNLNNKMLNQLISQARQQGISETDISEGLHLLGYK